MKISKLQFSIYLHVQQAFSLPGALPRRFAALNRLLNRPGWQAMTLIHYGHFCQKTSLSQKMSQSSNTVLNQDTDRPNWKKHCLSLLREREGRYTQISPNIFRFKPTGIRSPDADSSLADVQQLTISFLKDLTEKGCHLGDFYHLPIVHYSCSKWRCKPLLERDIDETNFRQLN